MASTGARKNSAERTIAHTRMEDEDVQMEYEYGEILGEGSFGKVYKAKHVATGNTVAIKEIVKEKAGSSGLRQLDKEVSIFKKVDHRNIIKLKEVIESQKKMYLIMELCRGGDLARLLQKRSHLTEADTKSVMASLAEAIKYLHQQGILHRDLKLENILLAEEPGEDGPIQIKVSDFGLSTQQNNNSYENMQEQYCGTLSYMAPEMNSTYSHLVDVWAMGLIMYYLLTSYPKDNVLNESLAADGPKFTEPELESVSSQAKDLLKEILTPDPAYRPSSGEVLNHEWFTGKKREYGNVLQMMKEFGQEQKEGKTAGANEREGGKDKGVNSAINGLGHLETSGSAAPSNTSSENSGNVKKETRKGSGGNKVSAGDGKGHTPPGSGSSKTIRLKATSTTPRSHSKTPTLKAKEDSDKVPTNTHHRASGNVVGSSSSSKNTSIAGHTTNGPSYHTKTLSKGQANPKVKKK